MRFWPYNAAKQKFRKSSEERFRSLRIKQRVATISDSNSALECDPELTAREKAKIKAELETDRKSTIARVVALTLILATMIGFGTYLFISQQVPDKSEIFNEILLKIQQVSNR